MHVDPRFEHEWFPTESLLNQNETATYCVKSISLQPIYLFTFDVPYPQFSNIRCTLTVTVHQSNSKIPNEYSLESAVWTVLSPHFVANSVHRSREIDTSKKK